MQETARKIAKVSKEAKLEIDEETYVEKFKPHMMDVVYAWSTGKSFAEICQMTDIFEGSIIRTMRRLEVGTYFRHDNATLKEVVGFACPFCVSFRALTFLSHRSHFFLFFNYNRF